MSDTKKAPGIGWRLFGAMFGRDKGSNGTAERAISNHKVLGTLLFLVAVGLLLFGGSWLDDAQVVEIVRAGGQVPSRWGDVPAAVWATIGGFLAVGVVKERRR